jgi:hypothetical protein
MALSLIHDFLAHYALSRCLQMLMLFLAATHHISARVPAFRYLTYTILRNSNVLTSVRSTAAVLRPESNVDDGAHLPSPTLLASLRLHVAGSRPRPRAVHHCCLAGAILQSAALEAR